MEGDTLKGWLYGVVHLDKPGYLKIGKTKNPAKRLSTYNTGCPERAYRMPWSIHVPDYTLAEAAAHRALEGFRVDNTEWFRVFPSDALAVILSLPILEE